MELTDAKIWIFKNVSFANRVTNEVNFVKENSVIVEK